MRKETLRQPFSRLSYNRSPAFNFYFQLKKKNSLQKQHWSKKTNPEFIPDRHLIQNTEGVKTDGKREKNESVIINLISDRPVLQAASEGLQGGEARGSGEERKRGGPVGPGGHHSRPPARRPTTPGGLRHPAPLQFSGRFSHVEPNASATVATVH